MTQKKSDIVVLFGATSSLGKALAAVYAKEGYNLVLCARDKDTLDMMASDIRYRFGVSVKGHVWDVFQDISVEDMLDSIGDMSLVFWLAGDMGGDDPMQEMHISKVIDINYAYPAQLLQACAKRLQRAKRGGIVVIGSVAGDRGRFSNYVYGSAKGALALFAAGLRARLVRDNVHVMTVKLGYTDTPMTFGQVTSPLVASREYVARSIFRAYKKKKNVMYIPFFWRYIMWVIRLIPESLCKYLRF